ncbi:RluA family pseudouridine synthase [Paenibacillus hunanensis]|uniref:RluA family pseudouridine synthase n=1 Tax=Paenibacillus hunanensis TaxID=539262 RepID=UPI002025C088|nr:RluA family pseudouridine synthase [Paenibacillus hunanensis]MCL9661336.1 RluA family pseudouridine synthase [Paenibacillus hunanensis]
MTDADQNKSAKEAASSVAGHPPQEEAVAPTASFQRSDQTKPVAIPRPERWLPTEHAVRRGEWLEIIPDRSLDLEQPEGRHVRMMEWLKSEAFPAKIVGLLQSRGEIQLQGDHIRLRVFPNTPYGFQPDYSYSLEVLYEDDYVLVVHKPAGMNVHPSDANDATITLAHAVAAYYEQTGQSCAVRHVHRLDEDTTGPVLYAKNELALYLLDEQMRSKSIHRRYVALVHGKVNERLNVIDEPIGKDRHHKQRRRVSPGGQAAITHVQCLRTTPKASLVQLELETGRTHQIRVHMSYVGHPLIGDTLYGGKPDLLPRQALHGEQLGFTHPWTGEPLSINDPWPADLEQAARVLKLL